MHIRVADPEGRATVDKLVDGTYELWVDVPGESGRSTGRLARVTVGVGEHAEAPRLVVPEPDGLVLAGRVTDTSGRPISGAEVQFHPANGKTGEDGTFRLAGVQEHPNYLQITHVDFTPYQVNEYTPTQAPLHVQLRGKGTISGSVLHNGQPVEKFRVVRLNGSRVESYRARTMQGWERLADGIDGTGGSFSLRAPEGSSTVIVIAEDLAPGIQATPGVVENQTLRLPPFNLVDGGVLAGAVLNADGTPAAGCEVSPDQRETTAGMRTDSSGRFQLAGLPSGTFTLWLTPPGGASQRFEIAVTAGQTQQQTFRLHVGNAISGLVTLAGRPVEGANVRVEITDAVSDSRMSRREVKTDNRGRYTIDRLEDGLAQVSAEIGVEPNQRGVIRAIQIEGGGEYAVDLHSSAGTARLQGKLVDSDGRSLAGRIEIQIVDIDRMARMASAHAIEGEAVSQEFRGSYDISGLPEGMCLVQFSVTDAENRGIVPMKQEGVQLRANEVSVKDFVMEKR
jgi:hypothetical protein